MAAIHDHAQFGHMGMPGRKSLDFARATFLRPISAIAPGGPVQKQPGAAVFSAVFRRRPTAGHDRFRRLSFTASVLPVFRDTVDAGGSANILPLFLGGNNGLLRRPRTRMVRFAMNPKFGPKTRPC